MTKPVTTRIHWFALAAYVITSVLMFDWVSFGIDNADALVGYHSALLDTGMVGIVFLVIASLLLIFAGSSRSGLILGFVACAIAAVPVIYALLTEHVFIRYFSQQDLHRYAIVGSAAALTASILLSIKALRTR